MTEMLKGTLEGIVLAVLATQPAYGYEITARLREQGFSELVEGTVYALLIRIEQRGFVDVQKVPSEKGPPRKVYSLNTQGRQQLEEFFRTWTFLSERIARLQSDLSDNAARGNAAGQGPHRRPPRTVRNGGEGNAPVPHVLRRRHRRRHPDDNVRRPCRPMGTR